MSRVVAYGLTRVQRDCLLIVQELTAANGIAPSLEEIGHELGFRGKNGVHRILVILRDRGHIDWLPCKSRSLTVVRPIPMPEEPTIIGTFAAPEVARAAVVP